RHHGWHAVHGRTRLQPRRERGVWRGLGSVLGTGHRLAGGYPREAEVQRCTGWPAGAGHHLHHHRPDVAGLHVILWRTALRTGRTDEDRKSTRLNYSHVKISYAVICL